MIPRIIRKPYERGDTQDVDRKSDRFYSETQLAIQALQRRRSTHYVVPFLFVLCLIIFLTFAATTHSERSLVLLGQPKKRTRLDNDWRRPQGRINVSQCPLTFSYTGAKSVRVLSLYSDWPIVLWRTLEEVEVSSWVGHVEMSLFFMMDVLE
jgi:hypothetical protein